VIEEYPLFHGWEIFSNFLDVAHIKITLNLFVASCFAHIFKIVDWIVKLIHKVANLFIEENNGSINMSGQLFFEEYLFFIALTLLSVFSGLLIRFLASALGIAKLQKRVFILDELIGQFLLRKSFLQIFTRIYLWNVLISSIVICSGIITLGVLPLVWAFLNLGLFFPDVDLFRHYLYPWIEEATNIFSAALGAWIGQNLHAFPSAFPFFVCTAISISGLYMVSALLETFKINYA